MNMRVHVLSQLSPVRLFATLWTVAPQAALSMEFSRQEYWSGLPCPPPEDLPNPEIKPASLMSPALAGGLFTTHATWEAQIMNIRKLKTKAQLPHLRCCQQKQGITNDPAQSATRGSRPPKPLSGLAHQSSPTLTPSKESAPPFPLTPGTDHRHLIGVLTPSHWSTSSSKALPEFLFWLLISLSKGQGCHPGSRSPRWIKGSPAPSAEEPLAAWS